MRQEQFLAWSPDMGEEENDGMLFKDYDEECAARAYAECSYNDDSFDCEMIVCVKCTAADSAIRTFAVEPYPTVKFYSREIS